MKKINQEEYNRELKSTCEKLFKSFGIKIETISMFRTNRCIKKIVKLNKKTENKNIKELIYVLGRVNQEYKKYCNKNNYYTNPEVNKKIKDAYIKLSRKLMKIETSKSNVEKQTEQVFIKYDSNTGKYIYYTTDKDKLSKVKEYPINNVKKLGAKRANVVERLKRENFGINIFDELGIDEDKFYKINPDIVNILLCEKKIDYAKKYIKEVAGGETVRNNLNITYRLNNDLTKGVFSAEENKEMLKMAKNDSLSSNIEYIGMPKINIVEQTKNAIESFKEKIIAPVAIKPKEQLRQLKNLKTGKCVAFANSAPLRYKNDVRFKNKVIANRRVDNRNVVVNPSRNKVKGAFRNTNTGKIVAYASR